jgi:hypothetical protein
MVFLDLEKIIEKIELQLNGKIHGIRQEIVEDEYGNEFCVPLHYKVVIYQNNYKELRYKIIRIANLSSKEYKIILRDYKQKDIQILN